MKRLEWALENEGLDFDDVVWTDKCTVQLESHIDILLQEGWAEASE